MSKDKLHNINKTGFKTPEHYFESLEDGIMNKLHDKSSLENIQDTGYKVPDNYFESLEDTIIAKLPEGKDTKVIPLFAKRNIIYASGIAALVMVMFGLFYNATDTNFESLDTDLVETYLQGQDLNTNDLAALFSEDDFTEDDFAITNTVFTEESLENYLLDNANLEDLIEQ